MTGHPAIFVRRGGGARPAHYCESGPEVVRAVIRTRQSPLNAGHAADQQLEAARDANARPGGSARFCINSAIGPVCTGPDSRSSATTPSFTVHYNCQVLRPGVFVQSKHSSRPWESENENSAMDCRRPRALASVSAFAGAGGNERNGGGGGSGGGSSGAPDTVSGRQRGRLVCRPT